MKKIIWILLDNRIGSRHQAEGIANYLNPEKFEIINKEITYTHLAALPNFIRGRTLIGLTEKCKKSLSSPFPDIVLSASRRTAPVARWIKKQNPQTQLIQLLHIGKCGSKDFTFIFTPEHDKHKYSAPNIQYTIGSPHAITEEKLKEAKHIWQNKFSNLPHPITALIIGGAIKKSPFTNDNAQRLAELTKKLKEKDGGSLLITTSRRTGKNAENIIMQQLKHIPNYAYLWGNTNENPYLGFLACADNLIVTGDSVSMCCEATATNKPLQIFTGDNWLTPKHLRFVDSLYAAGYATPLSIDNKLSTPPAPLNVAKELAEKINSL